MHELSIASALLELVARHTPPGTRVLGVLIEAGPLQAIDPEAMAWAWRAVAAGGPHEAAKLDIEFLPWRLRCPACNREWSGADLSEKCQCGGRESYPIGGADLRLRSLVVDDAAAQENGHASPGDRERLEAQR